VRIGDFVEIGAKCTVARGTITDTIVGDHVKTDDHVHIAHNCVIGARSILTACAELSGRVTVGERCWLGPNCSIMDGVRIGDGATVGLGAVVVEDVPAGRKVMGLGALDLRALIRLKRRIAFPND
jgi:UDP-3-O-[3-hydroxymyristoyl] glucosamine N-acyltransferase